MAVCEINDAISVSEDIYNKAYDITKAFSDVDECNSLRYEITQYAEYYDT